MKSLLANFNCIVFVYVLNIVSQAACQCIIAYSSLWFYVIMADSEKYKLYNRLLAVHGKSYSDKKKDTIQKQVKSFWDELKEKHLSGSNPYHHLHDLKKIRMIPEFEPLLYCNGIQKPVLIITVDGGPDENPRYEKTIACAVDLFCSSELDALFLATNAPGRSAFNRIERLMAPLSRELAGVI